MNAGVQTQFMNHTVVCNFSEGFSACLPENLQYVVNSLIGIYWSGLHKIPQRFNKSFDVYNNAPLRLTHAACINPFSPSPYQQSLSEYVYTLP
jgi:hypothetical protein